MFQDRFDLNASDTGEPLQDVVDSGPVFKILKQRFHGDSGPPEYPRAADLSRHTLYRRTLTPIQHHDREPTLRARSSQESEEPLEFI